MSPRRLGVAGVQIDRRRAGDAQHVDDVEGVADLVVVAALQRPRALSGASRASSMYQLSSMSAWFSA
ncbi:MAG: hypothetical protein R3F14_31120 [Polyangiaceae bacterium]